MIMNDMNLQTIEQVKQFLGGNEALEFRALSVREKYDWIEEVMIKDLDIMGSRELRKG